MVPSVCLAILSVCVAPPGFPLPLIVAHRGASYDAPENTLAAFQLAWRQGADAIEGDFHLSGDGHVVCIHDRTTKRVAGVNLTMADSTLDQLRQLDVGAWKGRQWAGERIPTLQEVLAILPADKKLFLEVKCGPEIIGPIKNILGQCRVRADQIVIIAFDTRVIAEARRELPQIKAYLLVSVLPVLPRIGPNVHRILANLRATGADGMDANAKMLNAEFARRVWQNGFEVHVWTVDDPALARRMMEMGAASITTNRPGFLRAELMKLLP